MGDKKRMKSLGSLIEEDGRAESWILEPLGLPTWVSLACGNTGSDGMPRAHLKGGGQQGKWLTSVENLLCTSPR